MKYKIIKMFDGDHAKYIIKHKEYSEWIYFPFSYWNLEDAKKALLSLKKGYVVVYEE